MTAFFTRRVANLAAFTFLRHAGIARNAVSLGGVETLTCHPMGTIHSGTSAQEVTDAGVTLTDWRVVSVGIEALARPTGGFRTGVGSRGVIGPPDPPVLLLCRSEFDGIALIDPILGEIGLDVHSFHVAESHLLQHLDGRFHVGARTPRAASTIENDLAVARELVGSHFERFETLGSGSGAGVD